jgi:hypothetical protein
MPPFLDELVKSVIASEAKQSYSLQLIEKLRLLRHFIPRNDTFLTFYEGVFLDFNYASFI